MADVTVKMRRDEPVYPGGPVTADVHPDEVDNWLKAGWIVEAPEPNEPATSAVVETENDNKRPLRKREKRS